MSNSVDTSCFDTGQATIHGTVIAVAGRAVLIRGSPGSGKSDLALRCLAVPPGPFAAEQPMLVADDRVVAVATQVGVSVSAPAVLRGLIEVRGLGIVQVSALAAAELVLVVDLADPRAIERLPEPDPPAVICGVALPRLLISPFEPSAPLKLLLALLQTSNAVRDR